MSDRERLEEWMAKTYPNPEQEYVLLSDLAAECGSEEVVREWFGNMQAGRVEFRGAANLTFAKYAKWSVNESLTEYRVPASIAAEFRAAHCRPLDPDYVYISDLIKECASEEKVKEWFGGRSGKVHKSLANDFRKEHCRPKPRRMLNFLGEHDWTPECERLGCQPVAAPQEEPKPRRMLGNHSALFPGHHAIEHDESETCKAFKCQPIASPQPAAPEPGEGYELCERKNAEHAMCESCGIGWTSLYVDKDGPVGVPCCNKCVYRRRIAPAQEWEDVALGHADDGRLSYLDSNDDPVPHALAVSEPGFMGYVYEMSNGERVLKSEPAIMTYCGGSNLLSLPIAWRRSTKGGA